MKNSLDVEPPSKLVREKEVSRKKNINLNQLILTIDSNKIKSTSPKTEKNIEKQLRIKFQDYTNDENYLKTNNNSIEEISKTTKTLTFISSIDTNQIISDFNYAQKRSNTWLAERKLSNFYNLNSTYSFIPQIREENRREESSYQSKEQETKETAYVLHNLDEEPEKEE